MKCKFKNIYQSSNTKKISLLFILSSIIILGIFSVNQPLGKAYSVGENKTNIPYVGVNMRGYYTSVPQIKNSTSHLPVNYYDDSFRLISQAGMNHVRYVFFWESYVKNPSAFIQELTDVARAGDKWGINILYDNHQFHTSSWLNPQRGTGFPSFLFSDNSTYSYGSGGGPKYETAKMWWNAWWNRAIKDSKGTDGWTLLAEFLKNIVNTVDKNKSTLGYEIVNEPQVHSDDQWQKVGTFNTFMVNALKQVTQKTIAYSQQIPSSPNDPTIDLTSENMAKMAPNDKSNVVFKVSSGYGVPTPGSFFEKRLNIYAKAAQLAGVPLYVGEWNKVTRQKTTNEENQTSFEINPGISDITQAEANMIVQKFKQMNVWGMTYWLWNFRTNDIPNFNLITVGPSGHIQPTKYFSVVQNAYHDVFGTPTGNTTGLVANVQ
jgi:cellulase (glycosyl hydrolase family 5)